MNGPTRVLHVVFSLDAGGMENGVINVSSALDGAFEISVVCLESLGRMASRFPSPGRIHVLHKNAGFSPATVLRLQRCIRRIRPHVVHTHNLGPLMYGSLAACMGAGVPILHGEHSQLSPEDLLPKRLWQRRFFYRFARRVHTVSATLADELSDHGLGRGKLRVIVNGVDTNRFRPCDVRAAREDLALPPDVPVVGIVGRFGPYKRHDVLIAAFERLRAAGFPLQLLIVGGGGSEEARIRELCESSPFADDIRIHGFTDRPERLYPAMSLLAVPSLNEGLANVVLEAMASGVPVLSHESCGSSEVIESGVDGLVRFLGSAENLADELEQLLRDADLLTHMGRAARQKVVARFSLDRMVRQYGDLYEEIRAGSAVDR